MTPQAIASSLAIVDEQNRFVRSQLAYRPSQAMLDAQKSLVEWADVAAVIKEASSIVSEAAHEVAGQAIRVPATAILGERDQISAMIKGAAGAFPVGSVVGHEVEEATRLLREGLMVNVPVVDPRAFSPIGTAPGLDWQETAGAVMRDAAHHEIPDVDVEAARRAIDAHFGKGPVVVREPRPAAVEVPPPTPGGSSSDLAEVTAHAEARSNRMAVEAFLRDNGLTYELEHLEIIAVRLTSGTKPDRIHAAMSASLLFEGVADFVLPGQEKKFEDRYGKQRSVEKKDVRNRISAFIDSHLRGEISPHEARRLQGMIDFAHTWSAEGHHIPYPADQANRAYRDVLVVLAYVDRAYRAASLL